MKTGIYKITNLQNNKTYVGYSCGIADRWQAHESQLRNNCHHSIHLQRAYNKYGKDNFFLKY